MNADAIVAKALAEGMNDKFKDGRATCQVCWMSNPPAFIWYSTLDSSHMLKAQSGEDKRYRAPTQSRFTKTRKSCQIHRRLSRSPLSLFFFFFLHVYVYLYATLWVVYRTWASLHTKNLARSPLPSNSACSKAQKCPYEAPLCWGCRPVVMSWSVSIAAWAITAWSYPA